MSFKPNKNLNTANSNKVYPTTDIESSGTFDVMKRSQSPINFESDLETK